MKIIEFFNKVTIRISKLGLKYLEGVGIFLYVISLFPLVMFYFEDKQDKEWLKIATNVIFYLCMGSALAFQLFYTLLMDYMIHQISILCSTKLNYLRLWNNILLFFSLLGLIAFLCLPLVSDDETWKKFIARYAPSDILGLVCIGLVFFQIKLTAVYNQYSKEQAKIEMVDLELNQADFDLETKTYDTNQAPFTPNNTLENNQKLVFKWFDLKSLLESISRPTTQSTRPFK